MLKVRFCATVCDSFIAFRCAVPIDAQDEEEYTALNSAGALACFQSSTFAAAWGNIEMLKLLIEHKANTELPQDSGYTPLCSAADRFDRVLC